MEIKFDKYCLNSYFLFGSLKQQIGELLHFPRKEIEIGFNYLRFVLKHNNYKFVYWMWIYKKVEAQITIWVNKLLLRGGGEISFAKVSVGEYLSVLGINYNSARGNPRENKKILVLNFFYLENTRWEAFHW
jgi:hypothetical protein